MIFLKLLKFPFLDEYVDYPNTNVEYLNNGVMKALCVFQSLLKNEKK